MSAVVAKSQRLSTYPRAPILDWSSFARVKTIDPPCVGDLPHSVMTTSGRAALYLALLQLNLPTGSAVLVPTYHCPTMVAPVLLAGLNVEFYPLRSDGLPDLNAIPESVFASAGAIIVAHFFGIAQSFGEVRAWCDRLGIALIEDCAHCFFGNAGDRPVGCWGDFATASLSKFFPVPEAGVLASVNREITPCLLEPRSFLEQVKGGVDVFEFSAMYGGLRPLNKLVNNLSILKNSRKSVGEALVGGAPDASKAMMQLCDMGRISRKPLWISRFLGKVLSRGGNIAQRRENFATYLDAFAPLRNAHPLHLSLPDHAVPYVFPMWVDDADRAYEEIRARQLPVFRWDRIWPGTLSFDGDSGSAWSKHVLQLLCHQSLSSSEIKIISNEIKNLL